MNKLPLALALGLMTLLMFAAAPQVIDATQDNQQSELRYSENETEVLTEYLQVFAEDIRPSQGDVSVRLTNRKTEYDITKTLQDNDSTVFEHPAGNVTVTASNFDSNPDSVQLDVVYGPYFGWNDGAQLVMENGPVMIALVVFIILGAMVWGVINL